MGDTLKYMMAFPLISLEDAHRRRLETFLFLLHTRQLSVTLVQMQSS